jgi:hypothetical protein
MTEIDHRYGETIAFAVWSKSVAMHPGEQHPYFQICDEDDVKEWRPRLRLVGREG